MMTVADPATCHGYHLGDEARLKVKEVSVAKRQIDLMMLG
jgi:hypothetical protein